MHYECIMMNESCLYHVTFEAWMETTLFGGKLNNSTEYEILILKRIHFHSQYLIRASVSLYYIWNELCSPEMEKREWLRNEERGKQNSTDAWGFWAILSGLTYFLGYSLILENISRKQKIFLKSSHTFITLLSKQTLTRYFLSLWQFNRKIIVLR